MFFFLAFCSMLGYAAQDVLLVKYARKIDGLSLAMYRNLSFVITLLPLLLFTSMSKIQSAYFFLPEIIGAGVTGACAVWLSFLAYRFLPVGIYYGLTKSIVVILLTIFSFIFFQEVITSQAFLIICFVLLSTAYLGMQKNPMLHLDKKTYLGVVFTILASSFAAVSIFLMIKTSRELNPFVAAYFWETSIGIFALLLGLLRFYIKKQKIHVVDSKTFLKIMLAASPTLIGTGCLAFAVTLGPVSIASTIGVASIIVVSVGAHFLYHEKLSHPQWIGIAMVTCGIVALKLFA